MSCSGITLKYTLLNSVLHYYVCFQAVKLSFLSFRLWICESLQEFVNEPWLYHLAWLTTKQDRLN